MQELEKILEEIEEATRQEDAPIYCGNMEVDGYIRMSRVEEIICKHMDNDDWIPAEERLPDNANHKGAICPKYRILTEYGETVGWYNPDSGGWYVLLWFMTERFLESEIDFDRGGIPKVLFFKKKDFVLAWKPFEPYRPEKGAKIC